MFTCYSRVKCRKSLSSLSLPLAVYTGNFDLLSGNCLQVGCDKEKLEMGVGIKGIKLPIISSKISTSVEAAVKNL